MMWSNARLQKEEDIRKGLKAELRSVEKDLAVLMKRKGQLEYSIKIEDIVMAEMVKDLKAGKEVV